MNRPFDGLWLCWAHTQLKVLVICMFCLCMYTRINDWSTKLGLYACAYVSHVMHILKNRLFPRKCSFFCYYAHLGHDHYLVQFFSYLTEISKFKEKWLKHLSTFTRCRETAWFAAYHECCLLVISMLLSAGYFAQEGNSTTS